MNHLGYETLLRISNDTGPIEGEITVTVTQQNNSSVKIVIDCNSSIESTLNLHRNDPNLWSIFKLLIRMMPWKFNVELNACAQTIIQNWNK